MWQEVVPDEVWEKYGNIFDLRIEYSSADRYYALIIRDDDDYQIAENGPFPTLGEAKTAAERMIDHLLSEERNRLCG